MGTMCSRIPHGGVSPSAQKSPLYLPGALCPWGAQSQEISLVLLPHPTVVSLSLPVGD